MRCLGSSSTSCSDDQTTAAAPTNSQAFVDVAQASRARDAASFHRERVAARPAPVRSAVSIGSTTVVPAVNRKIGFSASSATARRDWRSLAARRYTVARVSTPNPTPITRKRPICQRPNTRSTAAATTL